MRRMLVTGAFGQIGSELVPALRKRYGNDNVIAAGHKAEPGPELRDSGPYTFIDVTNRDAVNKVVEEYDIRTVYHLAAILSAVGEQNPQLAWDVNINGLHNILETSREHEMEKVFHPSSIAAFGPRTPKVKAPQETVLDPASMYGVTKVAGETLCDYYFRRYGLDIRGIRFPGVISSEALPGGGTTDYAVAIFYEAISNKRYTCFVRRDTVLPMVYMPDVIDAVMQLMDAPISRLKHHSNFNLASMSFSAEELAAEIKKHIQDLVCEFEPDPVRQGIADSWPASMNDDAAREEWDWKPSYDLARMTKDMIEKLSKRHSEGRLYQRG